MKNIYFLTYKGVFSQHLKPWSSLDVVKLIEQIKFHGVNASSIEYDEALQLSDYQDIIFITSSSQNLVRKNFIEDVCYELMSRGSQLIPSFELLKAHENKGFQALISSRLGIKKPNEKYYLIGEGENAKENDLKYVLKTVDGAGSHGVSLISKPSDLMIFYLKNVLNSMSIGKTFKSFKQKIKKYVFSKKYSLEQDFYYSSCIPCCKQEFIDGLAFDYKVIVFHDKYYFLKRYIRSDDFRASGSNNFEVLSDVGDDLLCFSKSVFDKFNTPYMSIDIVEKEGKFLVIEFQSPHFGPYTVLTAQYFYSFYNGIWNKEESKVECLEDVYAYALSKYINHKLVEIKL